MICLAIVASVYVVVTHSSWLENAFSFAGKICLDAVL